MKALTICQPYATLIANGRKPIENRTWATSYRGPLVIHAGKSREWLDDDDDPDAHIYGAVVAVADLVACLDYDARWPDEYWPLKSDEHANGPWCWVLANVRKIVPAVPYRGAQGLWPVPAELRRLL